MELLTVKFRRIKSIIQRLNSAVVAYSGGVDSTLLLKLCRDILGEKVLAVTTKSQTFPSAEFSYTIELAKTLKVKHLVIESKELENQQFRDNSPERCYYCKLETCILLKEIAEEEGLSNIADGSNLDDLSDFRPGKRAAAEFGIRHPLQEAGLTKEDIRILSKELGLPNWDKPSQACLATRFPYGTPINKESLQRVEEAEYFLHSLGIGQLRVRHYDETARIEIEPRYMHLLVEKGNRLSIMTRFWELGYLHITLDLAGYRSGSLNEELSL